MTKDYINDLNLATKKGGVEASVTTTNNNLEKRVCTQCYWVGIPKVIIRGSWLSFFISLILITPFLLAWKFFRFSLAYLPLTRWFIPEDESEWNIFPETPFKLRGCRECKHPNSMVTINSREGQNAMYWSIKKEKDKLQPKGEF